MSDENKNNIPDADEVTFHKKSFLLGLVTGALTGGIGLSLVVYLFPAASPVLAVFAGSVCDPVKATLGRHQQAIACCEARMDSMNYELCKSKLVVPE